MPNKTNVAKLYNNNEEQISTASADFTIYNLDDIRFFKAFHNPNCCFFKGDTITFDIAIENNGDTDIYGLIIKDPMDNCILPINGDEYDIQVNGEVISAKNPIEIKVKVVPKQGLTFARIKGIVG